MYIYIFTLLPFVTAASPLQPAFKLIANGANKLGASTSARDFQLDSLTPSLSWAPQHFGKLELDELSFTVSIRERDITSQDEVFDFTFEDLTYPQLKVPDNVLKEATSYEWVVDTFHPNSNTSLRSDVAGFHIGLLDPDAWDNIPWIGSDSTNLYRTEFTLDNNAKAVEFIFVWAWLFTCSHKW